MAESIFNRISQITKVATRQEKLIIDLLLTSNPNMLSYMSISEFAQAAKVADSTVLRFCRKLGLRGYSEFRMLMAQSKTSEYSGNETDFAYNILTNITKTLQSTYELISHDSLEQAARLILEARHVYAMGSGNSGVAAMELRNKLLRLGIHIHEITDSHMQAIAAATLDSRDVLVLFSVSGGTKDVINLARTARQQGVKTIIVTNYIKSPLSAFADIQLSTVSKRSPLDGGSLASKISQLYVIDVLITSLFRICKDSSQHALERTAIAVLDKEI